MHDDIQDVVLVGNVFCWVGHLCVDDFADEFGVVFGVLHDGSSKTVTRLLGCALELYEDRGLSSEAERARLL